MFEAFLAIKGIEIQFGISVFFSYRDDFVLTVHTARLCCFCGSSVLLGASTALYPFLEVAVGSASLSSYWHWPQVLHGRWKKAFRSFEILHSSRCAITTTNLRWPL